jgi:hypothetical protein
MSRVVTHQDLSRPLIFHDGPTHYKRQIDDGKSSLLSMRDVGFGSGSAEAGSMRFLVAIVAIGRIYQSGIG